VPALSVKAFPVNEKYGLVWVWLGPLEAADPVTIPDMSFIERTPPTAFNKQYLPIRAHHLLVVDNIMDLTHTDYLHPTSFGGGSNTRAHPTIEQRAADCVFVQWLANNETPSPIVRSGFPGPNIKVDMWTEELWHPCGVVLVTYGATLTGRPREHGIETINAHFVTPESSNSTHYFYCSARNFLTESPSANVTVGARLRHLIESEDKPMIEAQQRLIGDIDPLAIGPVLQHSDSPSVLVRRTLARLIAQERPQAEHTSTQRGDE
jgi:vanillate O-demethylase monooxygenase subunit